MNSIELFDLPYTVRYYGNKYQYFTHLHEVAEKAHKMGERILKVETPKRRRKSAIYRYHPKYRSFVKTYYYICEPIGQLLTYYK